MIEQTSFDDVIRSFKEELNKAIVKHPVWPKDTIHAVNVVSEEAGEACKAANDFIYHDGSIDELKTELAHTGAMCIRMLMNLPAK